MIDNMCVNCVFVFVFVWNEECNVGIIVWEICVVLLCYDVVVIDDGLMDVMVVVVRDVGVVVFFLFFNFGVGGVMCIGFIYVVREGYGVVI